MPVCAPGTFLVLVNDAAGEVTDIVCGCQPGVEGVGMPCPATPIVPAGTVALATDGGQCNTIADGTEVGGYFTAINQMDIDVECFIPWVLEWLQSNWKMTATPNAFIYVPSDVESTPAPDGQPGCPFDDVTMAYCPLDGNVYIGEAITWALYNGFDPSTGETGEPNDSTIVFALAHEIGHRLQHVAGMPMSDPEKPSEQIAQENQADCVGGTFIDYLIRRDVMILGDDTRDLADGIISIASTEGPERDHGTIDQRMRAFYEGYLYGHWSGLFACNYFVTDFDLATDETAFDPFPDEGVAVPTTTAAP